MAFIDICVSGNLHIQNQVQDYALQGERLANMNVLQFFTDTYDQDIKDDTDTQQSCWGRHKNKHVRYQEPHWKVNKKIQVI